MAGSELLTHELEKGHLGVSGRSQGDGLTSRRIAQWTVMMTKPWTESKTANRT